MVLIHFIFTFERVKFLLSIGSNMGNRSDNLAAARQHIEERCGAIIAQSSVYASEPWGFSSEQWFYNQSVILQTELTALHLIDELLQVEQQLGRLRSANTGYQSRLIDIDIIMMEAGGLHTKRLTIPHPRMANRMFVLAPSAEIAGHWIHPTLNTSVEELKEICSDKSEVKAL